MRRPAPNPSPPRRQDVWRRPRAGRLNPDGQRRQIHRSIGLLIGPAVALLLLSHGERSAFAAPPDRHPDLSNRVSSNRSLSNPDPTTPSTTRPNPYRPGRLTLAQRLRSPRDPQRRRAFEQALKLHQAGQTDEAAAALADLLTATDDIVLAVRNADDHTRPIGLHRLVQDTITGDPELLAAARSRSQSTAEALLSAARSGDTAARATLLREHPWTAAADRCRLDQAGAALAAGCLRDAATWLDGSDAASGQTLRREINRLMSPTQSASLAAVTGDDRDRRSQVPLPWPEWRVDRLVGATGPQRRAVDQWERTQSENQGSLATLDRPVVVGPLVLTTQPDRITASRLTDGTTAWTLARAASPGDDLSMVASGDRVLFLEDGGRSLVAIDVRDDRADRRWSRTLGAGVALGPPTVTPDGLMLLVRERTQLQLRTFTRDGDQVRQQPLAFGDAISGRRDLASLAIRPHYAAGRLICPTRLGQTVAIDTATAAIAWIDYDPSQQPKQPDRPSQNVCRLSGEVAYPTPIMTFGDSCVLLPPGSRLLHAVDLKTGEARWRIDRRDDTCLVGIDSQRVYLTGGRTARAVDLATGAVVWTTRIQTPTGRGLLVAGTLAIPQPNGGLVRLTLGDGTEIDEDYRAASLPVTELAATASDRRMGHLIPTSQGVVWCSPTTLAMHRTPPPVDRSAPSMASARVLLATGHTDAAVAMLGQIADRESGEWVHLMRESLFAQLRQSQGRRPEAVASLRPLLDSPMQSNRLLLHQLEAALAEADWTTAARFAIDLAGRPGDEPLTQAGVELSPPAAVADAVRRVVPSHGQTRLSAAIAIRLDASEESERLRMVGLLEPLSLPASLRLELAEHQLAIGDVDAADLTLLALESDPRAEAASRLLRTRIYESAGRPVEAAAVWQSLARDNADFPTPTGVRVGELIAAQSPVSPVSRQLAAAEPDLRPLGGSRITYETHVAADWSERYDKDRRKIRLAGGSIDIVDHVPQSDPLANEPSTTLTLLDRYTQRPVGAVPVPRHFWHPPGYRVATAGLMMPLGANRPVAVSLLTGRTAWTAPVESDRKFKVAHVGPQLTVLQDRNRLLAVRTVDGSVVWSRDDLDRRSGLMASESCGVSADDRLLVVFDSDGRSFTRYDTATGRLLGRGQIEPDGRPIQRPDVRSGHAFAYAAFVDGRWQVRACDPSGERPRSLLDASATARVLLASCGDDYSVAMVRRDADDPASKQVDLVVIDLAGGSVAHRISTPLEVGGISSLNAVATPGEFIVNTVPTVGRSASHYAMTSSDLRLPHTNLDGRVASIDRETGRTLWTADLGKATLLHTEPADLPVLLVMRRARPNASGERTMTLDVIDRRTGQSVARHDQLPRSPILRWRYDARRREVLLLGETTTVRLQLGGPVHTVSR